MKVGDLRKTHPKFDPKEVSRARDLFEGGKRMRQNVADHLIKNDVEEESIYRRRCKSAHYVNYCGPIGGYFASFVASAPITFLDSKDAEYWPAFAKNADGAGTDFNTFMAHQLVEALTTQCAYWRVRFEAPNAPVVSLADVREQGLDKVVLVPVPAESLIDWDRDDLGHFLWVREHEKKHKRPGTGQDPITVETWTEWRADGTASRWEAQYKGEQGPPDSEIIGEIDPPHNPLSRMPIVELSLPPHLYLMGHLFSAQLESFRKRCALSWSIERVCYAMPYFFLKNPKSPPKMGAGYYGILGMDDRVEYPSPPDTPFAVIKEYEGALKEEIYRVAQAMARGVENNAASVGRSGESKQADDRATEIVVGAYADMLRESAQVTLTMIGEGAGRGEAPEVGGLKGYSIPDPTATIEQFLGLQSAKIHSVTAMQEAEKRALAAFLPGLEEDKRDAIHKEIQSNLSAEELEEQSNPPEPVPLPGEPAQPGKKPPPEKP